MPLPKSTKYAMKKTSKGEVRLAFNKKGQVIEAKNMKTGKIHSSKEFAQDRKKKVKNKL